VDPETSLSEDDLRGIVWPGTTPLHTQRVTRNDEPAVLTILRGEDKS
jgi:hypothetical protein